MFVNEVLELQWTGIDFENRKINIDKTLHCGEGSEGRYVFFYTTVKTSASKRMLPMSEEVYEVL
ncbi:MAG: hypothetical protein R3Y57_06700 [Erysipelotrichaceae bacterium]